MTIVHSLDSVADWLREHVCSKVELKAYKDEPQTRGYEYELIHPAVFPLYVPNTEKKPPNVKCTTPSICVQIVEGNDNPFTHERGVTYHLSFATWDPGVHGADVLTPTDGAAEIGRPYVAGDEQTYRPSLDGWRGLWNFVDMAMRTIENARAIGGCALDPSGSIKFGAYDWDGIIQDAYPHWHAWIEFSTLERVTSDNPAINDLL